MSVRVPPLSWLATYPGSRPTCAGNASSYSVQDESGYGKEWIIDFIASLHHRIQKEKKTQARLFNDTTMVDQHVKR